MENNKETIVLKVYDLLKYVVPILNRLPRSQKFVFADRIQNQLSDLLEMMIDAYYAAGNNKLPILHRINLQLEKTRYFVRLGHDLGLFSSGIYRELSKRLLEIGRMNGGWIKSLK
ncbi:MAG: diversity-generating retroelement protein Avd [Sphingobacteriales bacterium]|nr:MAG: diversity-generating retroelement protein Avd [Sphingobacteriales bacterium]